MIKTSFIIFILIGINQFLFTLAQLFATGSGDGVVRIFDQNSQLRTLVGQNNQINSLELLTNNRLASGSTDGKIFIWNLQTSSEIKTINASPGSINSILLINQFYFASSSNERDIKIWRLQDYILYRSLDNVHNNEVLCLKRLKNGVQMVSGSVDGTVRIWDTNSFTQVGNIQIGQRIFNFEVLNNGNLVVACNNGEVRIYDINSRELVTQLENINEARNVKLLKNGYLAVGLNVNKIKIWNPIGKNGTLITELTGHNNMVLGLDLIQDNILVSAGGDIKIWDTNNYQELKTFPQSNTVFALKQISYLDLNQDSTTTTIRTVPTTSQTTTTTTTTATSTLSTSQTTRTTTTTSTLSTTQTTTTTTATSTLSTTQTTTTIRLSTTVSTTTSATPCRSTYSFSGTCQLVSNCIGGTFVSRNCTNDRICCVTDPEMANVVLRPPRFVNFTLENFLNLAGNSIRNKALYPLFAKSLDDLRINTCHAAAAFFSQLAGETDLFREFESFKVGNDNDNLIGNNQPGDGTKFRGRGAIHLRGKNVYQEASSKNSKIFS